MNCILSTYRDVSTILIPGCVFFGVFFFHGLSRILPWQLTILNLHLRNMFLHLKCIQGMILPSYRGNSKKPRNEDPQIYCINQSEYIGMSGFWF